MKLSKALKEIAKYKRHKEQKGTFLYLLKCEKAYKIGITNNFKKRFKSIQQSNPFEVIPVLVINNSNYDAIEKGIKEGWKDKKIKGEWFLLTKEDVEELKKVLEEVVNKFG